MEKGNGELQPEADVNVPAIASIGSEEVSGKPDSGTGDDNNNDDEEEDGDTTDGTPLNVGSTGVQLTQGSKRKHVQSRRMQEYQQEKANKDVRPSKKCPFCGRILTSGPGYRYHLKKHRPDNESYICDMCKKSFKSANGLKYHRKRKKCPGVGQAASGTTLQGPSSNEAVSQNPPTLKIVESPAERLMELAKIATGPQSPLLQSPGPDSRGSVTPSFFDDSETSAAIALSSMKKKNCSSETKKVPDSLEQNSSLAVGQKPKRPMNGFMLFAQRFRAELNKRHPEMNNRMISTKLSEEWNKMPESERQKWKDEARHKAEQQKKEHPDCWKRKK
ncbi:protein capicua homolog isoform X2 [Physella acuta]|uniref:protein capicua homolog isoform X2 n=1 Tax=Physella acuta TaxID=109671 RepID=UPI0027DDC95E|nr:protein capicua homolog isoform X2 [Physella acuta]